MRVSELAKRAEPSSPAIRFYESKGILPAAPRAGNGYREYTDDDVCRLRIVVSLRTARTAVDNAIRAGIGRTDEPIGLDRHLMVEREGGTLASDPRSTGR